MSTQQQRQEWRELAAAATPGEWDGTFGVVKVRGETIFVGRLGPQAHHDAAFIAAARAAVPALLADVDALQAEAARAYQRGWDDANRTAEALHVDLTQEDADNTAARQNAWQGDKIRALTQERDALAAELERVRAEAAQDRRAGANKLAQADAEIDGLRAQLERVRAQVADYIRQENEAADDERYNSMFRAPMFDDDSAHTPTPGTR